MIRQLQNTVEDKNLLVSYLRAVDNDFHIPLSSKQNLEEYASKLLEHGIVIVVMDAEKIVSCRGFYCNNQTSGIAYGSMMSTLSIARGKGYARLLIDNMINICREKGFKSIISSSVNPIAISLYKTVGYKEIKEEFCNGVLCVTLEYKL